MPMSSTAAVSSRTGMPPSNAASRAMRPAQPPPTSTQERARSSTAASATSSRATSGGATAGSSSTVPAKRPIASVRTQSSSTTTSTKRPHPDSRPGSASSSRHASVVRDPSQSRTVERSRSKTPVPSSAQASRERAARDREMSLDELAQGLPTQSSLRSSPFKRPAMVDPSERRRQVFRQIKVDLQRSERDGISIFPAIPACPAEARWLQRRLISLTEAYLDPSIADLTSASFYSFLALTLFPQSVDARRLRAKCLLLAGQGAVFPLLQERSQRGGAAAALAVLEQGPVDIFGDLGCAQIWSEACKALGRRTEAEEVLAWCLQNTSISSSSQPALAEDEMPELVGHEDRKAAAGLTQLGYLQKDARQLEAATHHFTEARKRDPWNWGAWVGLCDLDTAPEAKDAFTSSQIRHAPTDFLEAVMISLGGIPASDSDLDNTTTGLTSRTLAPVPQLKNGEASSTRTSALTSQSTQRPGSRPTTGVTAGTANGLATAKRTKATLTNATGSKRPVFGPGSAAAAFGIEGGGTDPQRSTAATSRGPKPTTMNRTLSQARTNERPPSSLSSGSRSTTSEKEKPQQLKDTSVSVGRDSLRRSTRSTITTPASGARRTPSSKSGPVGVVNGTSGGAQVKVGSAHSAAPPSRARKAEQLPLDSEIVGSQRSGLTLPSLQSGATSKKRPAEEDTDDAAQLLRVLTLKKAAEEAAKWQATDRELMRYIELMAGTYKQARGFQGRTALDLLSSHQTAGISEAALRQLKGSAEVGILLGRVHHDMAQYVEAEQCFHSVLRHHPTTMEGMDVFSLVLFHLNRQERLSALAQELSSMDSDAVETHIAIGNLFSLNASPSIALRSFRRACLTAPAYAYSFTLAGHECLALNQPLKALRFFREAIRIDPRHWNGWSGIASILATEERFDEARLAINRACSLNRFNSGLWEVMGLLNEQKEDYGVALGAYSEALAYNPKSSSACLRRAELLWKTGKFELAHSAFLQVVALLPSEPRAHLLLAESYMRKGGGRFAPMAMSRSSGSAAPSASDPMNTKAKAVGEPKAPLKYQEEIARHLAIAVDLEPALNRRVKAMGEGVGATLRGQASGSGGPMSVHGHLMAGEASVGSSFAGIDESRHPYSLEEEEEEGAEEEGEEGGEGSYSYASADGIDDSIGVLQDENIEQSAGDGDHQMSEEASGSVEHEGEDEENQNHTGESLQRQGQVQLGDEEGEGEGGEGFEEEEEEEVEEMDSGGQSDGGLEEEAELARVHYADEGEHDSGSIEGGGSEVEMSLE